MSGVARVYRYAVAHKKPPTIVLRAVKITRRVARGSI